MMDLLNQYATEIVLLLFTGVAFGLVAFVHLQRRKADRDREHAIDAFFEKSTPPAMDKYADDELMVEALLKQAITGTRQAARTLNDIQKHLEAVSARIGVLEDRLAETATRKRQKNPDRPMKTELISLADQVFGNHTKAARWLNKPKRRFDGQTPMQMIETAEGSRKVKELLYQIDDGMGA